MRRVHDQMRERRLVRYNPNRRPGGRLELAADVAREIVRVAPALTSAATMAKTVNELAKLANKLVPEKRRPDERRPTKKRPKKQKKRTKAGKRRQPGQRRPNRRLPYYATPAKTYAHYGHSPAEHAGVSHSKKRGAVSRFFSSGTRHDEL
jgi:hypothetical protein